MRFPFGRAVAVMAVLAGIGTVMVATRRAPPRQAVMAWTFSDHHGKALRRALELADTAAASAGQLRNRDGQGVSLETIVFRALTIRLQSMFMAGRRDPGVPDIVQLELQLAGLLLRPPLDGVGLLPLDAYLDNRGERRIADSQAPGAAGWRARNASDGAIWRHDGAAWRPDPSATRADHWRERVLPARVALWSKQGRSYGLPFDAHPTALAYRADLYAAAGIDMEAVRTWDEFQAACVAFEAWWRERGEPRRRAFELRSVRPEALINLLLQRGINLVDDDGIHLQDPRCVETLARFATWVAGPRRFGRDPAGETAQFTEELAAGELCAFLAPDWRIGLVQRNDPQGRLRGKLRLRPLPVWAEGESRTTTFGGSMLGIMATCPDPDAAWRTIEDMVLAPTAFDARLERLPQILPPQPEHWGHPGYAVPDPYFSASQAVMALYVDLADEVPPRRVSPASPLADAALADALAEVKAHVEVHGPAVDEALLAASRAALARAEADLRQRMAHSLFESLPPVSVHER